MYVWVGMLSRSWMTTDNESVVRFKRLVRMRNRRLIELIKSRNECVCCVS